MLTLNFDGLHQDANKMLNPRFGDPGQCLPLQGSSVFVYVAPRTSILPEVVTLEHVAKVCFSYPLFLCRLHLVCALYFSNRHLLTYGGVSSSIFVDVHI